MCLVLVCHVLGGHCGICVNVKLNIAKITETTVLGICRVNFKKVYKTIWQKKRYRGLPRAEEKNGKERKQGRSKNSLNILP